MRGGADIFPIETDNGRLTLTKQKQLLKVIKKPIVLTRIEITTDLRVVCGLHRFEALHDTGVNTVPCHFADTDKDEDIPMMWFRILDHLRSWTNPLTFTKLQNAINANIDFPRISKGKLIKTLQEMKDRNLIRKTGQSWTDKRGRNGRY